MHVRLKIGLVLSSLSLLALAGCAETNIQPLTKTAFAVNTTAAPACGAGGAQKVANKAAAIEVIKRGGDKFVFGGAQVGSPIVGMTNYGYGNWGVDSAHSQGLVVQMLQPGDPMYKDALSAREILGPKWAEIVKVGIPHTCTE